MMMWSQPKAQRAIIVAGCLAMAYTQLSMSPATIEFARSLGGNGLHIGILGALPAGMLFMQFLAAVLANHLQYRRRVWFAVTLVQRLVLLPLAACPFFISSISDASWLWLLILATAINHALIHFGTPLWLSWMGDYLPHKGLNQYWGIRHRWMQWTGAVSLLLAALFVLKTGVDIRVAFATLIVAGAVFGVADLMFFFKVEEPPVTPAEEPALSKVLSAPFRQPGFRSFISYACFWNFAAMIGAPFISLYLLSYVGLDLFRLMMLWMFCWVGGALLAGRLGGIAERFGNRPVLILCTAFKSTNMIALLLVPRDPNMAFWILIPVFIVDSILNAGIAIASNGFMIKNSPNGNRSMYIAAGMALAGLVGCATSVACGGVLILLSSWQVPWGSAEFNGFHLLFAVSLMLRLVAVCFAVLIKEPKSENAAYVVTQLIGATPMRILRFPVGLYRTFLPTKDEVDAVPLNSDRIPQLEHRVEPVEAA